MQTVFVYDAHREHVHVQMSNIYARKGRQTLCMSLRSIKDLSAVCSRMRACTTDGATRVREATVGL